MAQKTKLECQVVSPREYFREAVETAFEERNIQTLPLASNYLVELLEFYLTTENLFDEVDEKGKKRQETLAVRYLRAANAETPIKTDLFKRLGDTSLYVSGFFGDSLRRKIIDIDYYAEIGGRAYAHLSDLVQNELYSRVYQEFSDRFLDFVEVLTLISQKSMVQTNDDLLRLYDRYLTTGSELAKDELIERGLINAQVKKKTKPQ